MLQDRRVPGQSRAGYEKAQADRQAAVPCFACHGFSQLPSRSSCSHHTPYKGAGSFPPFASAFLGFKLPVSAIFQFSLPPPRDARHNNNERSYYAHASNKLVLSFLGPASDRLSLPSRCYFFPAPLISSGRIRAGSGNWRLPAVRRRGGGG